jgi:GNAT superfamily N-acetyltransferase
MTTHSKPASSAQHQIIRASDTDTGVLSQVIAEAFFSLDVCQWLIPDGAARRAAFPGYFQLYVEHALTDGLAQTTADRAAVALWLPGTGPSAPPEDYPGRLAAITGPHLANFQTFDQTLDHHHPAGAFHHHLAILAVRPGAQGQGIGTALLRAHHAVLDQHGTPAYLEASSYRSRALYLRHGYTGRQPFHLPDGGPPLWPMWRPATPAPSARPGTG